MSTKEEIRHRCLADVRLALALVQTRRQRLQQAEAALAQLVQDAMAKLAPWPEVQEELQQLVHQHEVEGR